MSSKLQTPETRVNTPVQLFLVYSRIARARLELEVYSELLKAARPSLVKGTHHFSHFVFRILIMYTVRI